MSRTERGTGFQPVTFNEQQLDAFASTLASLLFAGFAHAKNKRNPDFIAEAKRIIVQEFQNGRSRTKRSKPKSAGVIKGDLDRETVFAEFRDFGAFPAYHIKADDRINTPLFVIPANHGVTYADKDGYSLRAKEIADHVVALWNAHAKGGAQ